MFCGECGTKNEKGASFCSNCGAKLEEEKETKKVNIEIKTMSKKSKIILGSIIVLGVILFSLYQVGSNLTSPKQIAKDYINAVISNNTDKLYNYLDLSGDKTFISKKIFGEILKDSNKQKIENYKITDVNSTDLTTTVKFTYTTKNSSSEQYGTIKLIKEKNKKFLIFDSWKIGELSTDQMIIKNFTIKTIKDSEVTFAGVKVDSKYLDKEKTTSKEDVYVLPQVFTNEIEIVTILKNGFEIKDKVTPSTYRNSYIVSFDEDNLTANEKEKLVDNYKEILKTIYDNAINGKKYSEVKSNYKKDNLDLTELAKNYDEFVDKLSNENNKLKTISFREGTISSIDLNELGYLKVKVRLTYDYTVEYTNYNDEIQSVDKSSYDTFTLTLGYNDAKYYLVDINNIETYFSKY